MGNATRGATALVLATALSTASVAKEPRKAELAAGSPDALVVLKSEWWQPAPSMLSAYKLTLATYDPAQEKVVGGPFGGGVLIEARKRNFAEGYIVTALKPGRYVFLSYSQQDKWALCFNARTVQFEVKPGEVVYLGELDAAAHRQELTEEAVRSGKVSISGYGFADFFDLPGGPRLAPVGEAELATVRSVLARQAPGVTAPVRTAVYTPARFGTGSTLFAERRCGGYFAASAKGKTAKP